MIFARRALQRRLNELRTHLGDAAVDGLIVRLNRADEHRLATVWEAVVLHALSKHGALVHESPLPTGRRPDVNFVSPNLSFIADITTTSDEGLHEKNPYQELSDLIDHLKDKLHLPIGGVDLRVMSREERSARGSRIVLRLPPRKRLREFVRTEIEPRLRAQIQAGDTVLRVELDDEIAGLQLTIDPNKSPNSTGSYGGYEITTIKDRNPLYYALDDKADQLRGAAGVTGIIVGDADSSALSGRHLGQHDISAQAIATEFLRQHSSIDFVLLISIREESVLRWSRTKPTKRWLHPLLIVRKSLTAAEPLTKLVDMIINEMPVPLEMPVNAANQARRQDYDWGHKGSHEMSFSQDKPGLRIKISARELLELLAGRRTSKHVNDLHGWIDPENKTSDGRTGNPFEAQLREGSLPTSISVLKTDENDSDDWIEFQFGPADSAISPFR